MSALLPDGSVENSASLCPWGCGFELLFAAEDKPPIRAQDGSRFWRCPQCGGWLRETPVHRVVAWRGDVPETESPRHP